MFPNQTPWKPIEISRLRRLYPKAPWTTLLEAFPGRSRCAIYRAACAANIHRGLVSKGGWGKRLSKDPVILALRELRKAKEITQGELSITLGFNHTAVERYERGVGSPSYFMLKAWCEALGLELWLVQAGEPIKPRGKLMTPVTKPTVAQLLAETAARDTAFCTARAERENNARVAA